MATNMRDRLVGPPRKFFNGWQVVRTGRDRYVDGEARK
jgi:hypothetical protein